MSRKNRRQGFASQQEPEDRQDKLVLEGVVEEALPGTLFRIQSTAGHSVMCTLSGRLRINRIRLLPGDKVRLEVSPYDLTRGRVVFRLG